MVQAKIKLVALLIVFSGLFVCCDKNKQQDSEINTNALVVRIAEIEIYPEYLDEYYAILKEEAAASVKKESGVISIFPMYEKENPNRIRLLEIYADQLAYEKHLSTPHFKKYKTATLQMVKSLNLIDMNSIDKESMSHIFKKLYSVNK